MRLAVLLCSLCVVQVAVAPTLSTATSATTLTESTTTPTETSTTRVETTTSLGTNAASSSTTSGPTTSLTATSMPPRTTTAETTAETTSTTTTTTTTTTSTATTTSTTAPATTEAAAVMPSFVQQTQTIRITASSITMSSNTTILGSAILDGDFFVSLALSIGTSATVTVSGSIIVTPTGSISQTHGAVISCRTLAIQPSRKRLVGSTFLWTQGGAPATNAQYTAISYTNYSGNFAEFSGGTNSSCLQLDGTPKLQYGQTSLSVLVSTTDTCGGLSSGAIAGIAVGCTVGGIAIIAATIGAIWAYRRNKSAMQQMHEKINMANFEDNK